VLLEVLVVLVQDKCLLLEICYLLLGRINDCLLLFLAF